MDKNKKNIIVILILLIIVVLLFLNINNKKEGNIKTEFKSSGEELFVPKNKTEDKLKSLVKKDVSIYKNVVSVTLNVFNKNYLINIEEGANIYDAMKSISDSSFSFKVKEYSGLGYFVEEINGIKGSPGKYWIFYVNGKEASVGILNFILKDGDIIRWSQEGI